MEKTSPLLLDALQAPRTDGRTLWDILAGLIGYPALVVAHELKLFPLLNTKARTIAEIASDLSIAERPTEALVFANVALGMLQRNGDKYTLTPLAEDYLLESSPTYFGGALDLLAQNDFITSSASLKQAVLTNSPQTYGGTDVFESHEDQIERAQAFTRGMHSLSMASALVWPSHIDLSQHQCLLDIGGGSGAHAIGALKRWPQLSAIVFDIAPVCSVADDFIKKYQLETRMQSYTGDIWQSSFPAADIHFYSQIYHDWPTDKCRFLTQKSYESLPSGGKIVLHEVLYNDDKSGPFMAAASSVSMLLWTEGKQFSNKELTDMLQEAGFINVATTNTSGYWSIISAIKP